MTDSFESENTAPAADINELEPLNLDFTVDDSDLYRPERLLVPFSIIVPGIDEEWVPKKRNQIKEYVEARDTLKLRSGKSRDGIAEFLLNVVKGNLEPVGITLVEGKGITVVPDNDGISKFRIKAIPIRRIGDARAAQTLTILHKLSLPPKIT